MFVWQAHKGKVRSLAFSPDGQLLATATGTGRIVSLWNPLTGELVRKLTPGGDDRSTNAVAFAPHAPLFVSAMTESVRVWNTELWEQVALLHAVTNGWARTCYELALGPGAAPRLAAGASNAATVWDDAGQPAPLSSPRRQTTSVRVENVPGLDFSPSGDLLATNVLANAALWNAATGDLVRTIDHTHSNHHGPIKFSPDGKRVAVGYRNYVSVHPVEGGAEVVCKGHAKAVWSAGWSVDGRSLYTASADGTARQWNPDTGEELRTFAWGIGEIFSTAFSADGLLGAAASKDGKVVVWDLDA